MIEFLTILFIGAFLVAIAAFGIIVLMGIAAALLAPVVLVADIVKKSEK